MSTETLATPLDHPARATVENTRWRLLLDRARASLDRPVSTAALVLYALALAVGLGFGSAYLALDRGFPFGAVRAGPWTAWPKVGSREADPYARAVIARRGDIPLGVGEGLAFTAVTDTEGRPLDSACTYRVGSVVPPARLWTVTVYDDQERPVLSDAWRGSITSSEVLRDAQGHFDLTLSRAAAPGNWLRLPDQGRFNLALRLYDTPVAAGSAALDAGSLPAVERLECPP